jgi:hypothetical protein
VGVLLLTGVVGAVALVQRRAESAHGAPKGGGLPGGRTAADGRAHALGPGGRR